MHAIFLRDLGADSELAGPGPTYAGSQRIWRFGSLPGLGGLGSLGGPVGSHPGAELLLPFGVAFLPLSVAGLRMAAGSTGPNGGRQQRAEAPGQAGAGGRGEHQQQRQREKAQHDERRRAAVREQRAARGAGRRVDLGAGREVRGRGLDGTGCARQQAGRGL